MGKRRKMVGTRTVLLSLATVSHCLLGFSNQDGFNLRLRPRSIETSSGPRDGSNKYDRSLGSAVNKPPSPGRILGVRIPGNSSSLPISPSSASSSISTSFSSATASGYVDPFVYPPDISNGTITTAASDVPSGGSQPSRLTETSTGIGNAGPPAGETISIPRPPAIPPKPTITKKPPVIPPQQDTTTGIDRTTTINVRPDPVTDPNASSTASSASSSVSAGFDPNNNSSISWEPPRPGWTAPWEGSAPSKTYCGSSDWAKPTTSWIVIYTETITWTKDPKEFVGPTDEPIPSTCVEYTKEAIRNTLTRCQSTGTKEEWKTCQTTITEYKPIDTPNISGPGWISQTETIIAMKTAKNPTVVFSSVTAPDFGGGTGGPQSSRHFTATPNAPETMTEDNKPQEWGGGGSGGPQGQKQTPVPSPDGDGGSGGPQGQKDPPLPSLTVTVNQEHVVIDQTTFHNNPASPTQTVTVGSNTITIDPTKVAGDNFAVTRSPVPAGAAGAVFAPEPTTTNLGGTPVIVSSGVAVVDGTTFNLSPTMSSAVLGNGQTVTFGPRGVMIDGQTATVSHYPAQTSVVVAGGEVLTAVGPSIAVIRGTTITYGPGTSSVVDINGDLITAGPMGVTLHGSVIGGYTLAQSNSLYELVGGATITQMGQSLVIIKGTTYSVGPGAPSTTLTVGTQTITLGPAGVTIATVTFQYPFGSTTTVVPGATPTNTNIAAQTSSKGAAPGGARSSLSLSVFMTCIAIGVRLFGFLLF